VSNTLAARGGPKAITADPQDMFDWPVVTREDEEAVLDVLRRGGMSGTEITKEFEREFAEWMGVGHALAYNNGTASIRGAMWACGVGMSDEILCPSITMWASCLQALTLGAVVNFLDVEPDTVNLDPDDIEHRVGPRTKAIIVVHYGGYPCDMDRIMPIARKHGLRVIEDVSHAQGAMYKGRMCGTFGDVAAMSLMSGKSLAIGEGGILVTDDPGLYERAVAYGHYERTGCATMYNPKMAALSDPDLARYAGVAMGGYKHRIHQLSSAMGRVQLKYYPERMAEIDRAMNHFWDLLDDVPGIQPRRPATDSGLTCGGWYAPFGLYRPDELGGLPVETFREALAAEGAPSGGVNFPLHTHPVFHDADLFGQGRPTVLANAERDVRQGPGSLPAAEAVDSRCYRIPWFKHYRPEIIEEYAGAYRKVAEHYDELLD
jgi:dTDP-4-amino-4,6-dideoxygalactose transaminase